MAFWDFLFGAQQRTEPISRYTPQQTTALNQLLSRGLSGLQQMQPYQPGQAYQQGQAGFDPIAESARAGFREQTIPTLAERFTTTVGGGQRTSAFPRVLAQAGTGLERDLAALRAQYGQQQQQINLAGRGQEQALLQNLLGMGLAPQFDISQFAAQPGLLQALAPLMGYGGSMYLGSRLGMLPGSSTF